MNINDLKNSAEKLTLSEEAKSRILEKCAENYTVAKSGNPAGSEEFTDHVFTVEHYKPRRFTRIAAGIAACAVIAASAGMTMKLVKNQPKPDKSAPSSASVTEGTSPETSGDPIAAMLAQDFTINNDGTTENPYTDKLSPYQRERIRELLNTPARTEIDNYDMTDCTGIKFISGNYYYFIGVKGDVMSWSRNYIDPGETEPAALKGYTVSSDIEGNTEKKEIDAFRISPDTDGDPDELIKKVRKYYKLSENIEDDLRAIINMPLENIVGYDFFAENLNDISENERNEIRSYIHGLELKKIPNKDAPYDNPNANITLNYEEENLKYQLNIVGSCLTFSVTYFQPDGGQTDFTSYYSANDSGCAEHILSIARDSIERGIQENINKLQEEASRAQEEEKLRKETEEQAKNRNILNVSTMFSDDMHVGWFPYGDDVGRGVSDEVRALLFSKLSRLQVEPGDISELEKNADKAVVVYGSTIDNSKSLSVIIFDDKIVINSKENKDQCFKTDNEFLYDDIIALLEGEGNENLLAPFYPPAEGMCEYSGISSKTLSVDKLNEIAEKINTQKWYPVNSRPLTQGSVDIKVYSNLDSHNILNIYLDKDHIYIGGNSDNTAESQRIASVYCCYDKSFSEQIKKMLEAE